jgi:hypothetical protein
MTIKDQIKENIKKIGEEKRKFKASDISVGINNVSRQYVTEVLKEMVTNSELLKEGGGRYTIYTLPKYADLLANRVKRRFKNESLNEDEVLENVKARTNFLNSLKDNVSRIFYYAFTEMVNNAIEHSQSDNI